MNVYCRQLTCERGWIFLVYINTMQLLILALFTILNKLHKDLHLLPYRMPEEASSALTTSSLIDAGSTVETYELKLGIRDTDRLEVHLRFLEGRAEPEVIQLKKDDSRILTIDVMCLNQ